MSRSDWVQWHDAYDDPASSLHRRLRRVQQRVGEALDGQPAGPIRVLSMCAGQGRDLLEPLAAHPRRDDVRALLVERDPHNAAVASDRAGEAGLDGVEVRVGDAGRASGYASVVPVDLALVCGVFGNVSDAHVRRTIDALPRLVRVGGTVIWTRHRAAPDLTPAIRSWLAGLDFDEVAFDTEEGYLYGVGTHVHRGTAPAVTPDDVPPDDVLFTFTGDGADSFR